MSSEDLFSKALENPTDSLEVKLPQDDVDIGIVETSDEEAQDKRSSAASSSSDGNSDSDSDDNSDSSSIAAQDEQEVDDDDEEASPEGAIKSKHEIDEEPIPGLPDGYEINSNAKISEIGVIKSAFDNNVIIHCLESGERRVLKEGSILCLEDRTLIGTLCEVFGKLENPFYRVTLPPSRQAQFAELKERVGQRAFIVVPEAHWVDTFELKKIRGTDASNGYDEELSEDEQEFSDDEKEALYKRLKKERRKNKNVDIKDLKGKIESGSIKKPKVQRQPKQYPKMQPPVGMTQHTYRSRSSRQDDTLRQPVSSAPLQQQAYYPQMSHASAVPYQAPMFGQQGPPMQQSGYYHPPAQPLTAQGHQFSPVPNQHIQQVPPPTYNTPYGSLQSPPSFYQQTQQVLPTQPYPQYQQVPLQVDHYHSVGIPGAPQPQANMQQVLQLHSLLMQQQQLETNQKQSQKKEFNYDE
ncbi:hypothetical protein HG536_0D03080 [Torulaspora globosa]|uniref:H/ACA ribonucleoprotein complex non-core subunit NAF1 n=1 Tax=Torulaspora globosa TaxID=48254 RepID=A0A7G3ZH00_9SACH|nr:uncharacterized protein HG536_0D03080 [Torulaspora globosa]QLL32786.1 hypothetical protein HG536_0D03080 [Torulaspora globosa]